MRNTRGMIFKSKEDVRPQRMSASLLSLWNSVARLGLARPTASEFALLIMLGASLLALRAFRENYFKLWILGWAAFVGSRLAEHCFAAKIPAPFDSMAVQATFMLAVGLLAGAVLLYTRSRDLILPLTVITPVLVGFAGVRILLWPDSLPLRVAVEVGYRIILLTASIALLRARRGRWEPAAWLLALSLPFLHLSWSPFTDRVPASRIPGGGSCARSEHAAGRARRSAQPHPALVRCPGHHRQHRQRSTIWKRGSVRRRRTAAPHPRKGGVVPVARRWTPGRYSRGRSFR